jgi:MtrB/PioB family decaheme-associated outer membrane protein
MKTHNEEMKVNILALAVRCALLATVAIPLGAYADDEADALKHPTNTVDFGALYSSQDSAKFGEYNGLNKEGAYGLGGFDVRGGNGYDQSKDSALRWKLGGANLGTTSRSLDGSVSDQGKWKLNLGYDELQHNITDTYQTPLQGNPGGNNFILPQNFGPIGARAPLPLTTISPANTNSLLPNQLGDFNTEQEHVNRKNGSLSTSYSFSDRLSAQIDYNHLDQSGAKLIGTGSQGGINVGNGIGSTGVKGAGEAINILMNPTSYQTDNVNAALNWTGDKGHLSGGYYGSMFHDDYNSLSWQSAVVTPGSNGGTGSRCTGANCYTNNTMSTAPSNSLHQANLAGGYNFSSTTKLAGGFSYGYNTQNNSYAPTNITQVNGTSANMMWGGLPSSSLNGVVQTTHGDLKLTNQSIKDLTLSTGFKFNERDNRTDSAAYLYRAINSNGAGNANYTGINTPYSNRKTQVEAVASYRLTKAQNLALAYEHEKINRWCNGVVGGAQCISSPGSDEDKIGLTYRLKALEDVNFNAGYTYANRRANFDKNYQANSGNYAITTVGTASSVLNGGNYLDYVAYPYANRNQNLGKAGVNWQVTQKLDLGLNGRYTYDQYDATLGVQNGYSTGVNVDATYSYAENSSISGYWSWQNGQRNLRNGGSLTTAPVANSVPNGTWTNKLVDNSNTFGLLARHGGMLNGKLEIIGDASYALNATSYSTQVPYNVNCGISTSLTCGTLPDINNNLLSLKLTGNYKVLKNGKVALTYLYQKLNSTDYFYNGQQFGSTPNSLMPTNLQPQNYTVNVVALTYSYAF